jgi:hypothetical protein
MTVYTYLMVITNTVKNMMTSKTIHGDSLFQRLISLLERLNPLKLSGWSCWDTRRISAADFLNRVIWKAAALDEHPSCISA